MGEPKRLCKGGFIDDQYSPSVLTAVEQAKLLPQEDWLAGEHCLAFTLPGKKNGLLPPSAILSILYISNKCSVLMLIKGFISGERALFVWNNNRL